MPKRPSGRLPGGCNPGTDDGKLMVRYWAVEINGWVNDELVFGEEMTSDQAIAEVNNKGIVRESLRPPLEIVETEYLKEISYRSEC